MMMMRVGVSQSGTVAGKNTCWQRIQQSITPHVGSAPTTTSLLSQPPEEQDIFSEHKELCLTRSFEIRRSPGIRIFWDLEGPRDQEIARSGGTQGSGSFEIRRGPGTAVTIDKKRSLWSWMTIHQETEGDWEADDAEESSTVFKRIYKQLQFTYNIIKLCKNLFIFQNCGPPPTKKIENLWIWRFFWSPCICGFSTGMSGALSGVCLGHVFVMSGTSFEGMSGAF